MPTSEDSLGGWFTCDLAQADSPQMVALTVTVVQSYVLTQCFERGNHLTDASTFQSTGPVR